MNEPQRAVMFEKIYKDEISDGFDWIEHAYIDEHVNKILYLDIAELWHLLKSYTQTADPSFLKSYRHKLRVMTEHSDNAGTRVLFGPLSYIEFQRLNYQAEQDKKQEA